MQGGKNVWNETEVKSFTDLTMIAMQMEACRL